MKGTTFSSPPLSSAAITTALGYTPLATTALLRSYLATTVTYNNTAALAATALSVTVEAAGKYAIELVVHSTSAVKALNMDFGGTATFTSAIGEWTFVQVSDPLAGTAAKRVTNLGTDIGGDTGFLDTADAFYTFTGSCTVDQAGTFLLRGAQNAADASDTTILAGSTLILTKMN